MKINGTDTLKADQGAAYVEFLMAFIPFFIMFLGMVQMCLMYAGDLVVQHAASRATRAAVVVLDDDPQYYDGAERRRADTSGTSSDSALGSIIDLFSGGGGGGGGGSSSGGPRFSAIRTAASLPLASISPSLRQLVQSDSVMTAIGSPETRAAMGVFMYNNSAMGVTFPTAPGATSYRDTFDHGDQVTARVTYLFHCGVPLVNRMMCRSFGSASTGEVRDELDRGGASGTLGAALGSYFKAMRGEATMPLQSAHYRYPSE